MILGKFNVCELDQLRHNEHRYGTDTAKTPSSGRQTTIHHDSRPRWVSNGLCGQQLKHGIHGWVYGPLITGRRIGRASCAHVGLRLGFGNARVPVHESSCRLAKRSTFVFVNSRGTGSGGSRLGKPSGIPQKCTRIYGSGGGVFWWRRPHPR